MASSLPDLCKLLKARLKDVDEMVSRISLDVIDQCQQVWWHPTARSCLGAMMKAQWRAQTCDIRGMLCAGVRVCVPEPCSEEHVEANSHHERTQEWVI
eukprot:3748170-Rhodomonas_salina.1